MFSNAITHITMPSGRPHRWELQPTSVPKPHIHPLPLVWLHTLIRYYGRRRVELCFGDGHVASYLLFFVTSKSNVASDPMIRSEQGMAIP